MKLEKIQQQTLSALSETRFQQGHEGKDSIRNEMDLIPYLSYFKTYERIKYLYCIVKRF